MTFDELVRLAVGREPYEYQRRLADDGLPDVLGVPTGAGKTLAAVVAWLYRRRFHPDPDVRAATPHWLVFTLPMRVLVEQTLDRIEEWLVTFGLTDEVDLHRLMGGEGRGDARWRYEPGRDAVFVCTMDMALSRVLNRGYGESRWIWPVDFGLFNAGTQWVFDEVQLMGPGLETSRQVEGLRQLLCGAAECRSTWMSATVDLQRLSTIDNPDVESVVELTEADRAGPLRKRLDARKIVHELHLDRDHYVRDLATTVLAKHQEGSRSIVVVNTVDRAREVHRELVRRSPAAKLVLVHSRFRPGDRQDRVDEALDKDNLVGAGCIVVSTQVLEAGVDISADTLLTEVAPWPSIVQRAGRCNRDGRANEASLWWVRPPQPAPYDDLDLDNAQQVLADLEGESAAPSVLDSIEVPAKDPLHPVLRRRDLIELFDTLPDLSGNDVDVSRFIRAADEIDVHVAWQDLDGRPPDPRAPLPSRQERCPVPLGALLRDRHARIDERRVWRHDHLAEKWVRCNRSDLRPGQVVIAEAADGGYDPEIGWSPRSTLPVLPVIPEADDQSPIPDDDTAIGDDSASYTRTRQWVSLRRHLDDVEREVQALLESLRPDLAPPLLDAAVLAGRYHDLGKSHHVFQNMLQRSASDDSELADGMKEPQPWAKSGGTTRSKHERPYFRHELASALALLAHEDRVLDGVAERDLVIYLVAAHHGRVRLGFRSLPGEVTPNDTQQRFALGVWDDDQLPPVELNNEVVPECDLDLSVMLVGRSTDGTPSWAERTLALRDRPDLGPFRLGFLEAIVRVADWQVSASYDREPGEQ